MGTEIAGRTQDWMATVTESRHASSLVNLFDDEIDAGLSISYTEHQANVIEKLSK